MNLTSFSCSRGLFSGTISAMKHILVLDIETTGIDETTSGLIELSAVRLSTDLQKDVAVFDELVRPEHEIPHFIERLTGITNVMVRDAPQLADVRERFQSFLKKDDIICGHNIQFDIGFLKSKGFEINNEFLDTFSLAQVLLPEEPSYSLEILTEKYEIEHKNAHRALADVRANAELLKILVNEAGKITSPLRESYQEIIAKSAWNGAEIIGKAISEGTLPPKKDKTKEKNQLSIFDIETENITLPELLPEDVEDQQELSFAENSAAEKIEAEMRSGESVLFALPTDISQITVAAEAARRFFARRGESVAVALPEIYGQKTPADFFRYAHPANVICETEYAHWLKKSADLSESETIVALKFERERLSGNSLSYKDFPAMHAEKQIVRQWLADDHTRCRSECPAKKMLLEAVSKKLFFCEYADVASCPAKHVLMLKSDHLIHHIDSLSRQHFSLVKLEKFLERNSGVNAEFVDDALFGIGLLKRMMRVAAGDNKYRQNLILDETLLGSRDIQNIVAGFSEAARRAAELFPAETEPMEDFQTLVAFLSEPLLENQCRFVTIGGDDDLVFINAPQILQDKLDALFVGKKSIIFLGDIFLRQGGRLVFGNGLAAPDKQITIASEFDYGKNALFLIPEFGGNSKNSDESSMIALTNTLLPHCNHHLLALCPNSTLVEKFCAGMSDTVEQHGFQLLSASIGSTGKIRAQLTQHKSLLVASASSLKRIDFKNITFSGCIQHRLFFDPPPDPAVAARNDKIHDEFLEYALPRAVQKFMRIFGNLMAAKQPFFWACLDAHFQRSGGFADEFLRALPPTLPIAKCEVKAMAERIISFLNGR